MQTQRQLSILLIYAAILFLAFLGALPADIMEARNFITAQEMVDYNNWLIPTMNGELRLTKPPLPTWITAIWGMLVGFKSEALLRIPAALMGLLLVGFLYKLIKLFNEDQEQAMIGGLVAASSFYLFLMSRTGSWDIYCHAFMLVAIYFLVSSFKHYFKTKQLLWCGLFLGLSFLSKGPIAFYALLLPFLIAYVIVNGFKDFKIVGWRWILLIVPFVVLSFAWPLYTYLFVPEEAVSIASKESANWLNYNVRPFYHYWSFPIQSGIWVLVFIVSLAYPFIAARVKDRSGYKLAFFWTVFSVVLLSIIPEKKERYLLPVLIPAAWMMSYYYQVLRDALNRNAHDLWVWQVNKGLLLLVCFAIAGGFVYLNFGAKKELLAVQGAFPLALCLVIAFCFTAIGVYTFRIPFNQAAERLFHTPMLIMLFASLLILPKLKSVLYQNEAYASPISLLDDPETASLDYVTTHPDLRIEMVWGARKRIPYLSLSELHRAKQAIGVFSSAPISEMLCEEQVAKVEVKEIAAYDLNRYPRNSKRHMGNLAQYFSIVAPK